jgi:preprotein translocase SecE subunit
LPLLLAACTLWLAYRIVHYPAFADFLIATEAELNKVSWTTRKRLVQDTIVVLTTMLFLTLFLFVVDLVWFKLLSAPWIGVLQAGQSNTEMIKDLDAQIERLQQEREAAALTKDFDKETALANQIDALTREKQNLLRKTTGEEDW